MSACAPSLLAVSFKSIATLYTKNANPIVRPQAIKGKILYDSRVLSLPLVFMKKVYHRTAHILLRVVQK